MTIIFLALLVIFLPLMPAESQDNGTKLQASKLVQIISPQAQQNFYTGNLKNFVQVLFATKIEVQQPVCLLDMDSQQNVSVPGKVQSATMVSCDLSSMEPLSVGRHQLWVVRSPDLLESTLSQQTPVQLNILASPGAESAAPTSSSTAPTSSSTAPISSSTAPTSSSTAPTSSSTAPTSTSTAPTSTSTAPTSSSTAPTSSITAPTSSSTAPTSSSTAPTSSSTAPTSSSTAPTSSSTTTSATDILTLTPVAATFDNQMGQVLVQLQRGGIDGKSVDGKMELDCELLMQNLSQLGENPKCRASFVGTNFTLSLQLGQNASLHPGDILGLYPLKVAGDSGSALSFEVARNQGDLVFLPVAGPANPGIPVISLVADTRRISLCPSVADSQLLFNVSDNSGNAQILTCKWAARIPNSILNSSATSNLAKVVPANNSNCSLTLSNKAITAIFSNFSDLSSKTVLELSVVACNSAGLCSSAQSLSLPVDSNPKLDVQIVGAPASTIAMARVPLSAKINYSECGVDMFASTEQNMSFIWLVNGSPVANNTSTFTIPAYSLAAGIPAQVKFVAKHENGIETSDLRVIEYQLQPIVPVLDSTAKSVTVDRTLLLDASASWSPNVRDWPLDHSWSCLNLTDGTKCQLATLGGKSGQLIIAAGKLQENRSFLFTDTIRDSFNSSVQVQIPVNVLPSNCPTVTLTVEQKNPIPLGFIHVKAVVRSPITIGGMLTLQWLLYRANGDSQEQMDLASHFPHLTTKNVSTTQTLIVSFSLPIGKMERFPTWPGLEPDQYYSLRLSATNGKGAAAFAERRFRIMALPPIQELLISPSHDLASLDTLIRLQPSLLNSSTTGRAYRVRFGIRYLLVNGESRDVWARASTGSRLDGLFFEAYLPTAWPQPHASCGQRIGYQGLLEVCDRIGGQCSRIASSNFTVGHFSMDAMGRAVKILRTRLDNGDIFGALELLDAVNQEVCGQWKSAELLDQIFDLLVDPLSNNTDSEQLLESLDYGLRLADAASAQNLQKFTSLLNRTRRSLGMSIGSGVAIGRTKRQATTSSSSGKTPAPSAPIMGKEPISETTATTLLIAYDVLLARDQSVVDHYLLNIRGILSSFCTQVDGMTTMQAFGREYTSAQAQGIVPGQPDFLNQTFSLAGNISQIVSFDSVFASLFASWWCGIDTGSQSTCTDICLGSAVTNMQALRDNEHLRKLYFLPQHAVLSVDQSVSNLYHIYLMDPLSGTNVSAPQSQFSLRVNVSITNYVPSTYYRCFFFTGSQWDDSACDSASSPKLSSPNQFQLLCTCHRANGILGVFSVNPPAPPAYPPHNEIQLFFTLATSQLPSGSQISSFFDQLSKATTITRQRFVQLNATMVSGNSSRVSVRLRPPFRSEQLSNSYSMQALKRTIQCDGGFLAYDNVLVLNMNDSLLKRSLIGDGHARRIPLRISRSFKEVVGPNYNDTSSTTFRWLNSMATNMRISEFRFKNPAILMGMLFNFTITVPFDGESAAYDETPLAAEEIAKLIEEMTYYGELDLRDQRDQPLPIEPLADSEVAELIVVNPTGPMTFVLGSILGAAITLTTLFIGTLVCLKVRSDRLIVQRHENMHTIDLSRASQITNVVPFHQRTGSETVFGTSRRRAGGQIKVDG